MFGRAAITTATLLLYASLTACLLGEERRPQRQVGIDNIIYNRANDVVVAIIKGSEPVVDGERISTGMG